MARPRSDDKRLALLDAAEQIVAERGLANAPTSAISKRAGVAEGTLFTYFSTKDDLVNALYRSIKRDLADCLLSDFPRHGTLRARIEHVWRSFVKWGVENPQRTNVLGQLMVTDTITDESKAYGHEAFVEIEALARESVEKGALRDCPVDFIAANMEALAMVTMRFIDTQPERAEQFMADGFALFWGGIALRE